MGSQACLRRMGTCPPLQLLHHTSHPLPLFCCRAPVLGLEAVTRTGKGRAGCTVGTCSPGTRSLASGLHTAEGLLHVMASLRHPKLRCACTCVAIAHAFTVSDSYPGGLTWQPNPPGSHCHSLETFLCVGPPGCPVSLPANVPEPH